MSSEEIERLIARSELLLRANIFSTPMISWLFTLLTTPLFLLGSYPELAPWWGGSFSLLSIVSHVSCRNALNYFEKRKSLIIWEYLGDGKRLGYELPKETREFGTRIKHFYLRDPEGKLFPLRQAIRLIDIYHRQQQRLRQLTNRLEELGTLNSQLSKKIDRLHQLGDENEVGKRSLLQFQTDITTLKTMRDQIEASCHRLEMLLISVQEAYEIKKLNQEIKKLNQEITGLSSQASSTPMHPALSPDESLADIERQIGREIETFLQLERETDRHFQ